MTVELLEQADIRIGGNRPWDMHLKASNVPERAFAHGSLGLGDAYMDGDWDAESLDEFSVTSYGRISISMCSLSSLCFMRCASGCLTARVQRELGRWAKHITI
jgi:hypothetical protein